MTEELYGRVSVLIPARNEEANIERAVRSAAAQRGVREIIVVDDQSNDRTGEILERLRAEIPQLRMIRIDSLPEGWMGKANALATAARAATGEWFLFTDADTEHRIGSLATLLARAESENIDLLSLSPGQRVPTWWEKSVIPLVYVSLARRYKFEEVSDPASPVAAANGQYILIRREAYERAGGHEALRAEILDDVALARRVKSGGGRILFLPGALWSETRMYRSFREMWEGWTKNLFALYAGKMKNILGAIMDVLLIAWMPAMALVIFVFLLLLRSSTNQATLGAALGVGVCLPLVVYEQWKYRQAIGRLGFDSSVAKYLYLGAPLFSLLLLNSARAHFLGRVRWKGRDYQTRKWTKGGG
jgi:glycosyltransferase involved in cell wall biosynthesis